jgi:hypothetical protein
MRNILVVVLLSTFATRIQAQQHQAREWYCIREPFAETTDGDVIALHCVAAMPKNDKLDESDQDALTKLEMIRYNARTFKGLEKQSPEKWSLDTGKGKEIMDAIRMGFGQKVGQLCQKHPTIVLAPLFPDLTNATTTLYGCKNIIAAPEK